MLYHENYASMLLGALCNQTELLFSPSFPLSRDDFAPESFHRIIFDAIIDLAQNGSRELSEIEIDSYLKNYKARYETFVDSNGLEFISNIKELTTMASYEMYWNTIRKFSLLRDMKEQGFDIADYYDEAKSEESQCANLNKYTIQDILNALESRQTALRGKYDVSYVRDEMYAGEDTEALLEEFKIAPAFGAFLCSPYLTQLFMGLNKGHLIMRSSSSGVGKTRMSIADLCNMSALYLWNDEAEDFVKNQNYCGAGLFIHTEMATRKEVNPIFLAAISGVSSNSIIQGKTTAEEDKRIIKAGEILKESKILLSDMPEFTSKSIERKIKECVEGFGVENVVFDYMQLTPSLAEEFKSRNGGVPSREDLVVKSLAVDLKAFAEKYGVRMLTSSQLNGNEKTMDCPDESCLSSAKSIKQKLDAGCIVISAKQRPKEMKIIEPYLKRKGFGEDREPLPNVITYIYKSRFGMYADQNIKIFSYFDRGTMRMKDCLVTDAYNQPISIPMPVLEGDF